MSEQPHPDEQPEPILDLNPAVEAAGYALFLADIRRAVSSHGMGVTDDDVRRMWDKASHAERYYWIDKARPIVHYCASEVLAAGWQVMTELLGIEGHDNPWRA